MCVCLTLHRIVNLALGEQLTSIPWPRNRRAAPAGDGVTNLIRGLLLFLPLFRRSVGVPLAPWVKTPWLVQSNLFFFLIYTFRDYDIFIPRCQPTQSSGDPVTPCIYSERCRVTWFTRPSAVSLPRLPVNRFWMRGNSHPAPVNRSSGSSPPPDWRIFFLSSNESGHCGELPGRSLCEARERCIIHRQHWEASPHKSGAAPRFVLHLHLERTNWCV